MKTRTIVLILAAAFLLPCLLLAILLHGSGPKAVDPPAATAPSASARPPFAVVVNGQTMQYDGRGGLSFKETTVTETKGGNSNLHEKVGARGIGLASDNPDALKMKLDPASANLTNGGGGSGGGGEIAGTFKDLEQPTSIFYIIGAIAMIVAALFLFVGKDVPHAIMACLAGLAFIAIGVTVNKYPDIWVAGFLVGAAWLGVWVWHARKTAAVKQENAEVKAEAQTKTTALVPIVKAIEDLPDATQTAVKERIAAHAGPLASLIDSVVDPIKATLRPSN